MIPNMNPNVRIHVIARYQDDDGNYTDARSHWFRPIIAWDDNGCPLIAGDRNCLQSADEWIAGDTFRAEDRASYLIDDGSGEPVVRWPRA